jgi:hypothetical protein
MNVKNAFSFGVKDCGAFGESVVFWRRPSDRFDRYNRLRFSALTPPRETAQRANVENSDVAVKSRR